MPKVIVTDQCEYVLEGKKSFYRGIRKDGTEYMRPYNAGQRCTNPALTVSNGKKRCLEQLGMDNPVEAQR